MPSAQAPTRTPQVSYGYPSTALAANSSRGGPGRLILFIRKCVAAESDRAFYYSRMRIKFAVLRAFARSLGQTL